MRRQHLAQVATARDRLRPRAAPTQPVMLSCLPAPISVRWALIASTLSWLTRGPVAVVRCWALRGRGVRSRSGRCSLLLQVVAFLCERMFLVPDVSLRRLVLVIAGAAVLPTLLHFGAANSPTSTPSLRREGGGEAARCTEAQLLHGRLDPSEGALHLTVLCITMSGTGVRAASPCGRPRGALHGMRERLPALPIGNGRLCERGGRSAIAARATAEEEMRTQARSRKRRRRSSRQKAQRRKRRRGLIAMRAMNPEVGGDVAVAEVTLATGCARTPTSPLERREARSVDVLELALVPVFA